MDSAPGLSSVEAAARLRRDGPNVLPHPDRRRWPTILLNVLREPMLLLLVAAAVVYQARRFRFLGQIGNPSEALIEHLTKLDYEHDLAFAAVVRHDGKDIFVGISRYSMSADGSNCECAVTVLDEWQHKGLGVLLMKHLIEYVVDGFGREHGNVGPRAIPRLRA